MSGPVHIAFLGCGFITGVHSRHLKALRDDVTRSYASRDGSKAEACCRRYLGTGSYGSYTAAIEDPAVDAVVIAVPPRFHLDLTLEALSAGKHVLVEKPAYLRMEDYERVLSARDRAGRVVLVGENDHYKPLAVCLRRLLREGVIGDLVFAHFTTLVKRLKRADDWRNDETMAGGDAFFEEGIHWLHLANSLGPVMTEARGFRPGASRDGPDTRAKSMMVAFRYDDDAVGALFYSREVPSLLRGLRLSKLFGRDGIITFESNGAFVLARGRGGPRLVLPGFRDMRGYQAMYRDFLGAIHEGRAPEMCLETAIADQRLMDQIYATPVPAPLAGAAWGVGGPRVAPAWGSGRSRRPRRAHARLAGAAWGRGVPAKRPRGFGAQPRLIKMPTRYDIIIIGTGAGGGTIAHALADTSAEILLLERGDFVPQEPENWDPEAVWKHKRYQTTETWTDGDGNAFRPYTHYCVGGNTKFWGSVLYRLRREDFEAVEHLGGVSPAWPIDYDTLEPYYAQAEQLYHVHGESGSDPTEVPRGPFPYPAVPHADEMAQYVEAIRQQGLHPSPLPLGLRHPGEPEGCILCNTCNSFPCRIGGKSDADVCCVQPIGDRPNVTLWTNAHARRVLTDAPGRRVEAVEVERGGETQRVEAQLVVVSCGAVNSAALLLRSSTDRHPDGLANSSGLVGRRYMAHLATMMQGFHPFRKNGVVFQKTVAINDFYLRGPEDDYPLGQIQSQGRTHGVMAQTAVPWIPLWAYNAWVTRGVDWLAMTEDLPRAENRVTVDPDGGIRLSYRPNNLSAHDRLVGEVKRMLDRLGFWIVVTSSHNGVRISARGTRDLPVGYGAKEKNTTHQCGTLCFGTDPRQSVLDPYCRSHDVENLFVVDASFFPSSAAVNPGLTIAAQALRVADHIKETELGLRPEEIGDRRQEAGEA